MGGGVHAQRQAAGDGEAGGGQRAGKAEGVVGAVGGGRAGAHHGQLRAGEHRRVTAYRQHPRRVRQVRQQRRVVVVAQGQPAPAEPRQGRQRAVQVLRVPQPPIRQAVFIGQPGPEAVQRGIVGGVFTQYPAEEGRVG